jgi:hypothetical protein
MRRKLSGLLLALSLMLLAAAGQAQGVHVALLPATQTVAPGDTFNLQIYVTQAGSSFNGFDAYVGYDPSAVTLLARSPISLQEGTYFASACSQRFHRFQQGVDRDTITDVLLCAGVSLPGPGQIYRLHFQASSFPQVTSIHFLPGTQFYNAGLYVNPDSTKDAMIGIGIALGVESPAGPAPKTLRMFAAPNPAHGVINFRIETDKPGDQRLVVADVMGRAVRRLENGRFTAGIRNTVWDCRNDSGLVVPPGNYFAILRAGAKTIRAPFAIVNR